MRMRDSLGSCVLPLALLGFQNQIYNSIFTIDGTQSSYFLHLAIYETKI